MPAGDPQNFSGRPVTIGDPFAMRPENLGYHQQLLAENASLKDDVRILRNAVEKIARLKPTVKKCVEIAECALEQVRKR